MNDHLRKIIISFFDKESAVIYASDLSKNLRDCGIDIKKYGYNGINDIIREPSLFIVVDQDTGRLKIFNDKFSHLDLSQKTLEDYIGNIYWISNERLDISNGSTSHHPAALVKLSIDISSPTRWFSVSKGTDYANAHPKFRHKLYKAKYTKLTKPTGFFCDTILFKAIKMVRNLKNNNINPCFLLDKRDLAGLQNWCV